MKKSELKQIIKEELIKEYDHHQLNNEILDIIKNMHTLFIKLKNNASINRSLTRKLYTDFRPLYNTLNEISNEIMNSLNKNSRE